MTTIPVPGIASLSFFIAVLGVNLGEPPDRVYYNLRLLSSYAEAGQASCPFTDFDLHQVRQAIPHSLPQAYKLSALRTIQTPLPHAGIITLPFLYFPHVPCGLGFQLPVLRIQGKPSLICAKSANVHNCTLEYFMVDSLLNAYS
ncbi:hypothetical protein O988_01634 [Pseudogymnoascus sp. VKM F-3808]|nr:hypothetical protein O988_01634 [Pseudogymnoascus sp. VKM F-3808]